MPVVPPGPATVPPWFKWGLRALPAVWAAAEALLDWAGVADNATEIQWRRMAVHWTRATPANTGEDQAICTFDFLNITGGQPDITWTTNDYQTVETKFDTMFASIAPLISSGHVISEYRWYVMQFAEPMTPDRRLLPSGPAVRRTTKNIPGTSTLSALPYQVAISVTERTAIPRHWGRFYLPGASVSDVTSQFGRWQATSQTTVATAVSTCYSELATLELHPIVVSTQADNVLGPGLLGVTAISVDDVPDVIRRRRAKQIVGRAYLPVP